MESNPVCHPSPAKKIKCLFLDYVQLLMIGRTGQWAWTLSATLLQWKIKNAHFWITFNFWWSAGLVDGLEDHLPPLSSQKKNAHFWIMFNFWWLARLVDGLEPHPPLLSSLKNKMLVFGLCSTSDDQPGWSMDSNPICHPSPAKEIKCSFWIIFNFWWLTRLVRHPSPAKKIKCSFLDYVQLLIICQAGRWTRTSFATLLQWKNKKCSFLDYVQLLMINRAGPWTRTPSGTPLQPKKICSFFDYIQLLMIG